MSTLGESLQIVGTVYGAILLPWAFLYLHDFISDRWQTIHRTFLNGLLHFLFAFLPFPYIIYYIYLQARLTPEPDYKELFAAATAAVFSVYHVLRSIWGLYQLHRFRNWAIAASLAFESAGYPASLAFAPNPSNQPDHNAQPPSPAPSMRPQKPARSTRLPRLPRPAFLTSPRLARSTVSPFSLRTPSSLRSADSSPKHSASHQPVACATHDPSALPDPTVDMKTPAPLAETRAIQRRRVTALVDCMLVNSSVIDNEFINSYSPFRLELILRQLRPLHRKGTFVRWAVVYLAQFGRRWLEDCVVYNHGHATWEQRRAGLAANVWATAVLRMETDCKAGITPPGAGGNEGVRSFLDPAEWHLATGCTDDQLFDKEFVLRRVFASGDMMPYECPVIDTFESALPSFSLYNPLIKEAVESLPTRYFDIAEAIKGQHMEWFAVFLGIKDWGGCVIAATPAASLDGLSSKGSRQKVAPDSTSLSPSDTPVRVLQDQLGFADPATLNRCAFPFAKRSYGRNLWSNRSILQVSARIDNWIALSAGPQLEFLLSMEKELGPGGEFFDKTHQSVKSTPDSPGSETTQDDCLDLHRSDAIVAFHKIVETKRLRYQLANPNPIHCHLETCLTFMGCVMEETRSALADTLNTLGQPATWCPPISREDVRFKISAELRNSLIKAHAPRDPVRFDSTIQERLLWECQNGVQYSWQNKLAQWRSGSSKEQHSAPDSVEIMILCILGFPSLHVLCKNAVDQGRQGLTAAIEYEIWPVAAPQELGVHVLVHWQQSDITAKIIVDSRNAQGNAAASGPKFQWQDWRGAFEGRLIGKSEWQRNHYMKGIHIRRTKAPISTGIVPRAIGEDDGDRPIPLFRRCLVFEGWRPFRAGMTFFELAHSSLIIIGDDMPTATNVGDDESSDTDNLYHYGSTAGVDAYARADMDALTDASVHLDSLLTLNKTLVKGPEEMHENVEEDQIEPHVVDLTPGNPSSSSDGPSFRLIANLDPPLPSTILSRAQEQDPVAMHVLAKWVLFGTHKFKKDYAKAVHLMERALVLGRNIKTACLLVKTLLNKTFAPDGPIDVDGALAAVELLWRDMVGRREVVTFGSKRVRRWRGNAEAELERMSKLVKLNLQVINFRRSARMMRDLADRLSTWAESEDDQATAKQLYESAILAELDSKSMMELGRMHKNRNPRFAAALFKLALHSGQWDAAKHFADLVTKSEIKIDVHEVAEVYEMAANIGHLGAMQQLSLIILQGGGGVVEDLIRRKEVENRPSYDVEAARALRRFEPSVANERQAAILVQAARIIRGTPTDSLSICTHRSDVGDNIV
eukprot:GFKZ01000299.1.p1 GENE.GFKZ01000299.1~~GFKZ01000299.1.p1  ORF type:complete len:1337 (+),score=160.78 GFKZ01000299.1:66-4013(+)